MNEITITILNWEKFNPRKDYQTMPWIRLETNLFFSYSTDEFTAEELLVWIFILTYAGKKNSPTFSVSESYLAKYSRCKPESVRMSLAKLEKIQCITVQCSEPDLFTNVPRSLRNVTNERNDTNITNEHTSTSVDASMPEAIHPLVEIWNQECGTLAKVQRANSARLKKCDARWKELPEAERGNYYRAVVIKIRESKFCNGQSESGWRATFDWLLQPDVPLKVMEGKYDNNRSQGKNRAQQISEHNKTLAEKVMKGELS
jgi:hypothetical protein